MTNKNILLIGGKAGSGKDTVADYLVDKHNFIRFAYADALKDHVHKYYCPNIDRKIFDTQEGKMNKITLLNGRKTTPRQLLIDISLKMKQENELIWIEKVIENINKCDNEYIVISDFRFLPEYTELIKIFNNVVTLKIERINSLNIDDVSERSLKLFNFDYTIENNSSKEELYKKMSDTIIF